MRGFPMSHGGGDQHFDLAMFGAAKRRVHATRASDAGGTRRWTRGIYRGRVEDAASTQEETS